MWADSRPPPIPQAMRSHIHGYRHEDSKTLEPSKAGVIPKYSTEMVERFPSHDEAAERGSRDNWIASFERSAKFPALAEESKVNR
jgi:hypothetical protein